MKNVTDVQCSNNIIEKRGEIKIKKTVEYNKSNLQMGDLLQSMNVSIRNDLLDCERQKLKKHLENYMMNGFCNPIKIDLIKFYLVIKGADEVGYLYEYVK